LIIYCLLELNTLCDCGGLITTHVSSHSLPILLNKQVRRVDYYSHVISVLAYFTQPTGAAGT